MKLSTIVQFSKNAIRFKEIVGTLAKYGLANWIKENDPQFIKDLLKTVPGKGCFIILRMYSPLQPWIDQVWRPGEIELVKYI